MTRRCSNCSHCGHNSRTCPDNRGPMLFGVRLTEGCIRKSSSMGSLSVASPSMRKSSSLGSLSESSGGLSPGDEFANLDMAERSSSIPPERKKGTPWTEEEHRLFLVGLKKLGQGDWRGISRNYVISRTPTQVASHAQKHFIRQANVSKRRRRSSLFDIVAAENEPENAEAEIAEPETVEPQSAPLVFQILETHEDDCQEPKAQKETSREASPMLNEQCQSIDATKLVAGEANHKKPQTTTLYKYPMPIPSYAVPLVQSAIVIWPSYTPGTSQLGASTSGQLGYAADSSMQKADEIIKPTALHSKSPIIVDETVDVPNLNIGSSTGGTTSQKQLTCQ